MKDYIFNLYYSDIPKRIKEYTENKYVKFVDSFAPDFTSGPYNIKKIEYIFILFDVQGGHANKHIYDIQKVLRRCSNGF